VLRPYFAVLIIFSLSCLNVFALQQKGTTDSLRKIVTKSLKKATPDTATINHINKLAKEYFEAQPDSTRYYGELEIKLSKQIAYKKGIANGICHVANVNTLHADYITATRQYTTALAIYRQINYQYGIGQCYMELGYIQDYLGHYDNALSLYNKALAVNIKTHDEQEEAECYNLMGITHDNKGDFARALDYYFKALAIDLKRRDNLSAASKYNNIGLIMQRFELYAKALNYYHRALSIWQKHNDQLGISSVYQNIGETYMAQRRFTIAIPYLRKAAVMFNQQGDTDGISLIYYDLGMYNYHINRTDSALYYLNLSVNVAAKNNIMLNKANAYVGLAMVYNSLKQYPQACNYSNLARAAAKSLNSLSVLTDATLECSKAMAGVKQFEEAYRQHTQYAALKSDLKHNESVHKIMLYNIELDFARKQRDAVEKQHVKEKNYQSKIASQRNQNLIYATIIGVLAILALVYYAGKVRLQNINNLLAEKNHAIISHQEDLNNQALKLNELNILKDRLIGVLAHDLRAPISTLRGLFNLMTDASITTEEFITMTPKVFNTLEHTSDFLDTLLFWINSQVGTTEDATTNFALAELVSRELIYLEDKLHQKNLTTSINIADDVIARADPNSVRIVIHNFLTNAIKFSNRDGVIEIFAIPRQNQVEFCLRDHGVGMSTAYLNNLFKSQVVSSIGTENESGTGMGLLFCKDLIEKQHGRIWANSTLGQGTELCFSLPGPTQTIPGTEGS
jgi:signal transduction histidine kinase/tetratricopeptide (TPR) repeat protein